MPSPFPGMNPYLESQRWAGVHHWLINELAIYLNVLLVSRSPQRPKAALYAFNLQDEIPLFPLPLQADEVEFPVDLKLLLDNLYDAGAYAQQIDYSQAVPEPKLSIADREWCDRILQENNLLK